MEHTKATFSLKFCHHRNSCVVLRNKNKSKSKIVWNIKYKVEEEEEELFSSTDTI